MRIDEIVDPADTISRDAELEGPYDTTFQWIIIDPNDNEVEVTFQGQVEMLVSFFDRERSTSEHETADVQVSKLTLQTATLPTASATDDPFLRKNSGKTIPASLLKQVEQNGFIVFDEPREFASVAVEGIDPAQTAPRVTNYSITDKQIFFV